MTDVLDGAEDRAGHALRSFALLTTVLATAGVATFAALLWAAVQDGRDETAFRPIARPR